MRLVGVGSAVITAKDQYGQTAKVSVTVTQKYLDELKYLEDLECSYVCSIEYGETKLYCSCDISASVYTTINNTKYTAKVDEDGYYVFNKIPRLAAGKKIIVYFKKGLAIYKDTVTVQKAYGKYADVTAKNRTYTGKALGSTLTVKYDSMLLKQGTDYTVKYSNNINVGTAAATISFIGNFKGAKSVTNKICPKGTTISSLARGSKAFTVKWAKQTAKMSTKQITGYQIQYSTSSTFASGNKNVTVKGVNNYNKKIGSLKAKTKYYVRVRTYMTISGKNYYSAWSPAKYVTTK